MNTKEMAKRVRLTRWAKIIRARSESGDSVRGWCRKNGINEKTYYYWQGKLREAALEGFEEVGTDLVPHVPARFAQVSLTEPAADTSPVQSGCANSLCAEIGGMRITVDGEYPTDKLAALLRELSSC